MKSLRFIQGINLNLLPCKGFVQSEVEGLGGLGCVRLGKFSGGFANSWWRGYFAIALPSTIHKPINSYHSLMIDKPMDIAEFFQLNSGKWFSQRTSHHLALNKSESGKSDIQIEVLDATDTLVVQLCQRHGMDPSLVSLGLKTSWTGMMDGETKKQTGSSLVVVIPSAETPGVGQLLQSQDRVGKVGIASLPIATYSLGADQVLTVITQTDSLASDERIWFAGPNLRLRSSKMRRADGFQTASFCSEIRMGVAPVSAN